MWPFSALKNFKKMQERDALFVSLKEAVDSDNRPQRGAILARIFSAGLDGDPLMPWTAQSMLDRLATRDTQDALGVAIWLMNGTRNETLRAAVAEKALALAGTVSPLDAKATATVSMTANVIVSSAAKGSELEARGMRLWHESIRRLSRTGIQYAFAAASNAALGSARKDSPLREEGVNVWAELVAGLAKSDKAAAIAEAKRVAGGYESFGSEAVPFRRKAVEALNRFRY